jgi:hypothetical protein
MRFAWHGHGTFNTSPLHRIYNRFTLYTFIVFDTYKYKWDFFLQLGALQLPMMLFFMLDIECAMASWHAKWAHCRLKTFSTR